MRVLVVTGEGLPVTVKVSGEGAGGDICGLLKKNVILFIPKGTRNRSEKVIRC